MVYIYKGYSTGPTQQRSYVHQDDPRKRKKKPGRPKSDLGLGPGNDRPNNPKVLIACTLAKREPHDIY